MKRYITCVKDEVAMTFDAFCAARGQTPYDFLADVVYKFSGVKRVKRPIKAKPVSVQPLPTAVQSPAMQQVRERLTTPSQKMSTPSCSVCKGECTSMYCKLKPMEPNMNWVDPNERQ